MLGVHGFKKDNSNFSSTLKESMSPSYPSSPGQLLFTISCLFFQKFSIHLQILMSCFLHKWENNIYIYNSMHFAFLV